MFFFLFVYMMWVLGVLVPFFRLWRVWRILLTLHDQLQEITESLLVKKKRKGNQIKLKFKLTHCFSSIVAPVESWEKLPWPTSQGYGKLTPKNIYSTLLSQTVQEVCWCGFQSCWERVQPCPTRTKHAASYIPNRAGEEGGSERRWGRCMAGKGEGKSEKRKGGTVYKKTFLSFLFSIPLLLWQRYKFTIKLKGEKWECHIDLFSLYAVCTFSFIYLCSLGFIFWNVSAGLFPVTHNNIECAATQYLIKKVVVLLAWLVIAVYFY